MSLIDEITEHLAENGYRPVPCDDGVRFSKGCLNMKAFAASNDTVIGLIAPRFGTPDGVDEQTVLHAANATTMGVAVGKVVVHVGGTEYSLSAQAFHDGNTGFVVDRLIRCIRATDRQMDDNLQFLATTTPDTIDTIELDPDIDTANSNDKDLR